MSLKIGDKIEFKEDFEIKTIVSGNTLEIKKGDKALVSKDGYKIITGKASGKILNFNDDEKIEGYNYENISKLIIDRLNRVFNLEEYIENEEIDFDEIVDEVADVLMEHF